ncbi:50S ribosomal protein L31e [Candidatus Pacearchaeota archaeon]|jgi:large subunit ribosomal protein L31e|nr:50S ribosomal protein L31e [Candidatus Pacearchaeota archaeon]
MVEKKTENKIEREYVIPLRKEWMKVPRYRKTNKAVKAVKEFLARHMKIRDRDLNKIKVDRYVNELLWMRGVKNPPSKIKVKAIKEGDVVRVELVDMPANIKFKKLREEKVEVSAKEIAKKRKAEKVEANEEKVDENKDGVEDKKAEKEDKSAVVEAGLEIQKEAAIKEKHTTKPKSPKQEKNMKVSYNKSSHGQ